MLGSFKFFSHKEEKCFSLTSWQRKPKFLGFKELKI